MLRKKPYRPLFFLVLAVLILFSPALLHPTYILFPTFSQFSDTMVIHWPKAHLMAQTWQAEQSLPLWTPLILSGMPLAPNQLAMLFYPPAWLFLFFPLEPVFNFLFIFHLLWGGFGIYFLLDKRFGLSAPACLLGSLTFTLNGKWLAHAAGGHVSLVGAMGWLPWAIFGLLMLLAPQLNHNPARFPSSGSYFKWALVVAIALAMQIFTHTLLFLYTIYLLSALIVWSLLFEAHWRSPSGQLTVQTLFAGLRLRLLPLLTIPPVTGLLGMVQLLPLLELAQFSNRSLSLDEAADFALSPLQLFIGLLLPTSQAGHEHIIYAGLVSLLLAGFGLTHSHPWRWFFAGLVLFSALFALGSSTPIHPLFYYAVPGFRWVRTPARMFFVGAIGLSVLTGFGAEQLRQTRWPLGAKRWLSRLAVALGGIALLVGLGLAFSFAQVNRAPFALAILVPVGLGLILMRVNRLLSAQMTLTVLGLALFFDLASFGWSMMRFVPVEEALAPGRAAAEYLAGKPGLFRIYSPSYSLPMQTAAASGLSLADGVEPVHLSIYDQYMARAGGYHNDSFSVTIPNFGGPLETALENTEPNLTLLGLLNVEYLVSAFPMAWPGLSLEKEIEGTFIYRNERAHPRAWVTDSAILQIDDWLNQLEQFPPTSLASTSSETSAGAGPEPIKVSEYWANRLRLEVSQISEPARWLIISEIWYPGWRATVNGQPQPIEQVNGLLRGLRLAPPGPYQITLEYRPAGLVWGAWISGTTAILVVVAAIWLWRSARL